jgi:hypothetical protein
MNILNYRRYACFEYISNESTVFQLGDVVFKQQMYNGEDQSEIGIILQIHSENEFRTDMFGNCSTSEITLATMEQVQMYRPDIIPDILDENERTFFILTERKRVKGKVSFYIGELINGKVKLIDNDFTVRIQSNRGLVDEAVNFMVEHGRLDRKHINSQGYINYSEKNFNIIHVEGTDVTYLTSL